MKKILGLDLGTNSIGWALVEQDFENKKGRIIDAGSRIIPMSQDILSKFDSGQSISQTAERTGYRGVRRLYQRENLRRERLHRVLNILNFLPEHYKNEIDFENKLGQFKTEVKINYRKVGNKHEFIFMDSFTEMVKEFKEKHPEIFYIKKNGEETKIPYDWTIYYLRKKALKEKISKEELAWIILNFNQKRGYYQLRGEEEEIQEGKEKTFEILKVKEVVENGETNKKGEKYYTIIFDNGWKYDRPTKNPNDWLGKTKEFIVTTSTTKSGEIKRTYKAVDSEKDWIAIKKKTEQDIEQTGKYICEYIYDTLLTNPKQKIRGKLIKTIERKYYREELEAIIETQIKYHKELQDKNIYKKCLNELYSKNKAHTNNIKDKGFKYLFIDDIIFYQRPLKSQKSNISGCQYEYRPFYNEKGEIEYDENGNIKKVPLKAISKSHPLFQEFRLWQFIHNLRIHQREKTIDGKTIIDADVTGEIFITDEDYVKLFDFLNDKKEISQKQLIDFLAKEKYIEKTEKDNYRWNYVEGKTYPISDTRAQILSRLKKVTTNDVTTLSNAIITAEFVKKLWHIIYSVSDKEQYIKALETFAKKNNLDKDSFKNAFEKFPPFKSDYAAYSEKAIKKLLPLMRRGKYWSENEIPQNVKEQIYDIMERVYALNLPKNPDKEDIRKAFEKHQVSDDDIQKQLVKSFINLKDKNPLSGLNTYQAGYAVYKRHSEISDITKWETPGDIDKFLRNFKQHCLRNPIVEQVVTETLRTVRDIWKEYGDFSEIHLELGRELKNPADKRKLLTQRISENENTNHRIRQILKELMNDGVPEVKGHSPSHQEILKIYEEGVFHNPDVKFDAVSEDEIIKIRKNPKPSKNDIIRYKLWLEQGYISPYTGKTISLSKLFTTDYQIEHIIPQSRYFDNSLSNKVICESEVNQEKSNQTAYEFIKEKGGSIIEGHKILSLEEYETHCKRYFTKNKTKLKKLMMEDIPENFIERQINDTRYISKYIKSLLSNLVREDGEQSESSKHLLAVTGTITSVLKQDWGLNDKWNEIVLPRFERLNKLTNSNNFTYVNSKGTIVPTVPDELQKNFNKKRIDHRHHALDAIVIATTTRKHIQYLNSLNNDKIKYDLQPSLLIKNGEGHYTKHFQLPWKSFPVDAKKSLENIIVSFKQNLRVINKATNRYEKWIKDENGQWKKKLVEQKGHNWAIRKPLHKETVSGKISFDAPKGKVATAVRASLTEIKNRKHLEKITDKGIVKILKTHLNNYIDNKGDEDFEKAFSPEGIEQLNKNIVELNGGQKHQPIYKVRLYEIGSKFALSENKESAKSKKYVEAAKGTNLYFNIYEDETGKRHFETVPLNEVIAWQKWRTEQPKKEQKKIPLVPVKNIIKRTPVKFLFSLSPNDLVYVPTDEEMENFDTIDFSDLSIEQKNRIYKMVSSSNTQCFFIWHSIATIIQNKFEFGPLNKTERDFNNEIMIKERCIKLKTNRLGHIIKVGE